MKNGIVYISLTSHLPGEEPQLRRMMAELRRLQKDDFHAVRLSYEQMLNEESKEKEPEIMTFRLDEDGKVQRVSMKRPKSQVLMEFEEGKTCFTTYPTPAGILDIAVRARKVEGAFTEDRLFAEVFYEIQLGDVSQGEIHLRIEAYPADVVQTF